MFRVPSLAHWSVFLCLGLVLAGHPAHAASPNPLIVPLDEDKLAHLETTLDHFTTRFKTEPALKKDIKSFGGDGELSGNTMAEVSASIAKRHPKFAAAAVAEKWTPGELYLTYILCVGIHVSETVGGATSKDAEDRAVRRSMEFYERHRPRVDAMVTRFSKALGYE